MNQIIENPGEKLHRPVKHKGNAEPNQEGAEQSKALADESDDDIDFDHDRDQEDDEGDDQQGYRGNSS